MRRRVIIFPGILAAAIVSAQAAPPASRQPAISVQAQCPIPFSATLPDEAMTTLPKVMTIDTIKLNRSWLEKRIRSQLDAHRADISKADPAFFGQLDKHAAELTDQAEKDYAAAEPARQTAMHAGFMAELKKLKAALEGDTPVLTISGSFVFTPGTPNPGEPGWRHPQARIDGAHFAQTIAIPLELTLTISPPGITIDIPVALRARFDLSAGYDADGANTNISDISMPESPAGATPAVTLACDVALSGDADALAPNGQITKVGAKGRYDLPRLRGTIKAPRAPTPATQAP